MDKSFLLDTVRHISRHLKSRACPPNLIWVMNIVVAALSEKSAYDIGRVAAIQDVLRHFAITFTCLVMKPLK